jgi:hypothetical protein
VQGRASDNGSTNPGNVTPEDDCCRLHVLFLRHCNHIAARSTCHFHTDGGTKPWHAKSMSFKEKEMQNNSNGQGSSEPMPSSCSRFQSLLLSRKEAAAYLGVAEQTLAIWKTTGRYSLPVVKIGRLAKYRKSDLDAFIASRVQA